MCKLNILTCTIKNHNHIIDKNLVLCIEGQKGNICICKHEENKDRCVKIIDKKTMDITSSIYHNIIPVDCSYIPENIRELKYNSEKIEKLYSEQVSQFTKDAINEYTNTNTAKNNSNYSSNYDYPLYDTDQQYKEYFYKYYQNGYSTHGTNYSANCNSSYFYTTKFGLRPDSSGTKGRYTY
jgi:hypothetical protein